MSGTVRASRPFGAERRCRSDLDCLRSKIEPLGDRFDDLQLSHAGVKATKQHETKVVGGSVLDQALRQLQIGKVDPALAVDAVKLHIERRVPTAQIFGDTPVEERADRKDVAFRRARSDARLRHIVEGFALISRHLRGRNVLHAFGEHSENRGFRLCAHFAEAIRLELVFQKALDFGHECLHKGALTTRFHFRLVLPM